MSPAGTEGHAGTGKHVFLDSAFIAECQGVEIRTNPPELRGPVLKGEKPWEAGWMHSGSILQVGDVLKMWYGAHPPSKDGKLGAYIFCYAESSDGMHWERPNLGLVEFEGSKGNNILPLWGDAVCLDPKAKASQRYKMLVVHSDPSEHCVYVACSPDGIHWKMHEPAVFPLYPDTQNQLMYDPRIDKYVAYVRSWAKLRKVARVEMDDPLKPWPYDDTVEPYKVWGDEYPWTVSYQAPVAMGYDELDPPNTDMYSPAVSLYPWAQDAYLAFPSMYGQFPEPPEGKFGNDGLLEIQLAVSRDGVRFERPDRTPYVPLGVQGGPQGGSLYMVPGLARMGDEIYHYYVAYAHTHAEYLGFKELRGIGAFHLAVQRLDGFRSADSAYGGGWLTTTPMTLSGNRLEVNIDCRAVGSARVEIRDDQGHPIKGFTLEDCDVVRGNPVHHIVTWGGKEEVAGLSGRRVRLHFRMRNTKLYAFEFIG